MESTQGGRGLIKGSLKSEEMGKLFLKVYDEPEAKYLLPG